MQFFFQGYDWIITIWILKYVTLIQYAFSKKDDYKCAKYSDGRDYTGTINVTKSGKRCQVWGTQKPHTHGFNKDYYFPYDPPGWYLTHNHCRKPDNEPAPWCYTEDKNKRYEACEVPICEGND